MTGNLKTIWPAMNVWHKEKGKALTAYIEAECELTVDGVLYKFVMKIDPTPVTGSGRNWTVSPCRAETLANDVRKDGSLVRAAFDIDAEKCKVSLLPPYVHMDVYETSGDGYIVLPTGRRLEGFLVLPATKSDWQRGFGLWVVRPVVAYGNVA